MANPHPMPWRRCARATAIALASITLFAGCGLWQPTRVPMRIVSLPAACATKPDTLVAFLPGSYSAPEDYISHGFVAALRGAHVAADVQLVDAHLGYYSERSILERLQQDVLAPANAAGYRHVWLIGISIGAYGALIGTAASPALSANIDGVVAIAPYLGDRRISVSIAEAGGLARWPASVALPPNEYDVELWRWLQKATRPPQRPALYLAYGESDRFAYSDRLLAAALPAGHVVTAPGGHDWEVWETVWPKLLRQCRCRSTRIARATPSCHRPGGRQGG